jgi:hypothetical protein
MPDLRCRCRELTPERELIVSTRRASWSMLDQLLVELV